MGKQANILFVLEIFANGYQAIYTYEFTIHTEICKKLEQWGTLKKLKSLKSYFIEIMRTTVQPATTLAFRVSWKAFSSTHLSSAKSQQGQGRPCTISLCFSSAANVTRPSRNVYILHISFEVDPYKFG